MPNPSQREVCANTSARSSQSRGSTPAGNQHSVGEPESLRVRASSALRAAPSRGSPAGPPDAQRATRANASQQRRVVLLRDQAADRQHERRTCRRLRVARASARTGRRASRRGRSGSSGAFLPAAPPRRGSGERPPRSRRSRRTPCISAAVDVAKRAEQVPVVVVARRDERDAQHMRGERAVGVGVDHVGVQQVGLLRPHALRDRRCEPRRDVETARDALPRDPALVERIVEACLRRRPRRARGSARRPLAPAARAEARAGAARRRRSPCTLVRCRTFTGRGSARRARSTSSTIRSVENRSRIRSAPSCAETLRDRSRSSRSSRQAAGEALDVADRREEARLAVVDDRARSAGVGRDDRHAGGERLDRDDRRRPRSRT